MKKRSGIIEKNEVWAGEILVTGDIVIPEQVSVTVAAGSTLRFAPANARRSEELAGILAQLNRQPWLPEKFSTQRCSILVKGALTVAGTEQAVVTIGNEGWGGSIIFLSERECGIEHALVTHASYAVCHLQKANTRIRHSELTRNSIGLFYLGTAVASVAEDNAIHDNTHGIVAFGAESENEMAVRITGNDIAGNAKYGIWFSWVDPVVRENTIRKNDIGINQVSCRSSRIENNEIAENRVGIFSTDILSTEIFGNTMRDNADEGILAVENVKKAAIAGNTLERNQKAVECAGVEEGVVRDNTVAQGRVGMRFLGHMRGEVSGNRLSAIAQTGVECLGTVKLKVTGNTFTGMESGITVAGAAEVEMTANEIREAQNGILCAEEARVTIEKNTIAAESTGISCVGQGEGRIKDNRILGTRGKPLPEGAVREGE